MIIEEELTPVPANKRESLLRFALEYRGHFYSSNQIQDESQKNDPPFAYLVSTSWLEALNKSIGYPEIIDRKSAAMTSNKEPGILNGDLVEPKEVQEAQRLVPDDSEFSYLNVVLKKDLRSDQDYKIVEKSAWEFLRKHYSKAIEIKRPNYRNAEGFLKTLVYFRSLNTFLIQFDMSMAKNGRDFEGWKTKSLNIKINMNWRLLDLKTVIYEKMRLLKKDLIKNNVKAIQRINLWKLDGGLHEFTQEFRTFLSDSRSHSAKFAINGIPLNKSDEINLEELGIGEENCIILAEDPKLEVTGQKYILTCKQDLEESANLKKRGPQSDGSRIEEEKTPKDDQRVLKETKNGKCEYCMSTKTLTHCCLCQNVFYCSLVCLEKDKRFHEYRCEKSAEDPTEMSSNSKMGLTGLENMGNTCYMSSGIQCLSFTREITDYFLKNQFEKEINMDNPIGTKGELVKAYASLVRNLWYGTSGHYRPYNFKCTLGRANPMVTSF